MSNSVIRKLLLVSAALVVLCGVVAWRVVSRSAPLDTAGKLRVVTSFYPLADFAQQVGGNYVAVTNLTPAGAEPHDFDPSPRDIVTLQNAQVFIYNGAGLESWVERVLPDLQQQNVLTVKASDGIALLPGVPEETSTAPVNTPDAALADPHIWLDPVLAKQEVATIAAAFTKADPAHRKQYEANAAAYEQKLTALDQRFATSLQTCARRDIITSHAAFGYVAKQYTLHMIAIAGLSPDEEPSPQRLATIAEYAHTHDVRYIFFETLISPRLSETIASESGAQTITFNPLEGLTQDELAAGQNYLSVQLDNLAHLKIALSCS